MIAFSAEGGVELIEQDIFRGLYELPWWGTFLAVFIAGPGIMIAADQIVKAYHNRKGSVPPVGVWRFRAVILGDPVLALGVVFGSRVLAETNADIWPSKYEASWIAVGLSFLIAYAHTQWVASLNVRDFAAIPGGLNPFGFYHAVWFLGLGAVYLDMAIKGYWSQVVDPEPKLIAFLVIGAACFLFWLVMIALDDKPPTWFGLRDTSGDSRRHL